MDDDLLTLLAEQGDTIARLQAVIAWHEAATPTYWEGIYDQCEQALEDYCLATVGERRPKRFEDAELRRLCERVW